MEPIEHIFGQVIREFRERRGLSQEDFADKARIHRTYVSSIERGKVQISITIAQKVADALEIPLSRIWRTIEARSLGSKRG